MRQSPTRRKGVGLLDILSAVGIRATPEYQLNEKQEQRIRLLRSREAREGGQLTARMRGYRTELAGLQNSLGAIDGDIASYRAALSVERRPDRNAKLQHLLHQSMLTRGSLIANIQQVRNKMATDTKAMRGRLERLRRMNTMEAKRVRNGEAVNGDIRLSSVDFSRMASSFGTMGEMSYWDTEGDIDAMSFRGVSVDHEDEVPTNNLTPQDLPYYLQGEDAEFERGLEYLLQQFKICSLRRKAVVQLYYNTGDKELRSTLDSNEAKYKALRQEVAAMKAVGARARGVSKVISGDRTVPSSVPDRSRSYPGAVEDRPDWSEGIQAHPLRRRTPARLPVRDNHLEGYVSHLRGLIQVTNSLTREYDNARESIGPSGDWEEGREFDPDRSTYFQQYSTVGERPPPLYDAGVEVDPVFRELDRAPTLQEMTIRNSGDLAGIRGNNIIADTRDLALAPESIPIHKLQAIRTRSARDIIDDTVAKLKRLADAD